MKAQELLQRFSGQGDRLVIGSTLLYFAIPLAIFCLAWLRSVWAIACLALLLFGLVLVLRGFSYRHADYLTSRFLLLALLAALAWVALSGIGGFGHQNYDFHARSALFHDLIERSWPVRYDYSADAQMQGLVGDQGILVYYFAFWLPAAAVGKFLGWEWANRALFLWSVAGVFLTFVLTARYLRRGAWLIVPALVLASGMDAVGEVFVRLLGDGGFARLGEHLQTAVGGTHHLEAWPGFLLQYSSFTTQLFYVFNQAIPAWLATLLILDAGGRKHLLFVWALALPFAPLPALGLLPLVAYRLFVSEDGRVSVLAGLRGAVSIQNLVCAGGLALITAAFFATTTGQHAHGWLWQATHLPAGWLWILGAFYLLEFLLLGAIVAANHREPRGLLIIVLMVLAALPLYTYGRSNDFVMRASIPALLVLFLLTLQTYMNLADTAALKGWFGRALLLVLFLVGSLTPWHEMRRSLDEIAQAGGAPGMKDKWRTFGSVEDDEVIPYLENFVVGDPEEGFFYRFLMRQR
ncbi:MAG: hypothetical protein KIS85_04140 [Anaerolineales bacterium]|nr:hypothetical protein [Anaerolineales bacterium]